MIGRGVSKRIAAAYLSDLLENDLLPPLDLESADTDAVVDRLLEHAGKVEYQPRSGRLVVAFQVETEDDRDGGET